MSEKIQGAMRERPRVLLERASQKAGDRSPFTALYCIRIACEVGLARFAAKRLIMSQNVRVPTARFIGLPFGTEIRIPS